MSKEQNQFLWNSKSLKTCFYISEKRNSPQLSGLTWPKVVLPKKEAPGGRESEKGNQERGREILSILRIHRTSTTSPILPGPLVPAGKCVCVGSWGGGAGEGSLLKSQSQAAPGHTMLQTFCKEILMHTCMSSNTQHNKA